MNKTAASLTTDFLNGIKGSLTGSSQPPYGMQKLLAKTYTGRQGTVLGAVQAVKNPDEMLKDLNAQHSKLDNIQGIDDYRAALRRTAVADKAGGDYSKRISQKAGIVSSTVLLAMIGAIAGGVFGHASGQKYGTLKGILAGAGIGTGAAGIGHLGGAALAGLTPKRTWQQQEQYQQKAAGIGKNYFVPGFASYNYMKSLGRSKE